MLCKLQINYVQISHQVDGGFKLLALTQGMETTEGPVNPTQETSSIYKVCPCISIVVHCSIHCSSLVTLLVGEKLCRVNNIIQSNPI